MKSQDPRILKKADRLIEWFVRGELLEEIQGDLHQYYYDELEHLPSPKRVTLFWIQVLFFLRPFAVKKLEGTQKLNYYGMFKLNLKFGWRNLMKQKGFFAINIFGLAIGIATSLIITLFILDELSYDRSNENADRIARVVLRGTVQGEAINEAIAPPAVAKAFSEEIPEVEAGTRLRATEIPLISVGNQHFRESEFAYVDPNFFSVFTTQFIKGNSETALQQPNSMLITSSEAEKYFGDDDPIGKVLEFKEWGKQFKITGVIEEMLGNSHFHFDLLGSMKSDEQANDYDWLSSNFHSYVLINEEAQLSSVQEKIPGILKKYMGPQLQEAFGISMEQFEESGNKIGLYLQPLLDIHLYSDFSSQSEIEPGGNIDTLYIFSIIALFALVVSCINFINLSTAAASRRLKEVGLKKVLGSNKKQLIAQFLGESFMTTLGAMFIATFLIGLSLPFFNEISGKSFHFLDFISPKILVFYLAFGLLLGLLAGIYPAFILSSFQPIAALGNKVKRNGSGGLRSSLVTFQFAISTILIIGTIIVTQQMKYIQSKDLGYDKDGLIVIKSSNVLDNSAHKVFKEKLTRNALVEQASIANHLPAGPTNNSMDNVFLNEGTNDFRRSPVYIVDEDYIPTMGITLLAGSNFSSELGSQSRSVIVNETFASTYGLGENPVGKTIETTIDQQGERQKSTVIGLVKDFHFQSLHKKIEPLIIRKSESSGIIVRTKMTNVPNLLQDIEEIWHGFNTDEPFDYALLDELYNDTYIQEQSVGKLFQVFSTLTIFIATLGLFGLVTFTIARRTKEIGIRKSLGSTAGGIVSLISLDFLKLIIVALVVAFPLGYLSMNVWLQDFAYRIDIQWWVFLLAGAITLLISYATVALKALKAAQVNPVEVLKDE